MWDNYPFFFFFFFFWETNTHTHKGEGNEFLHKGTPQLYAKAMVNFKEWWDKLYYTQHTLLSNAGQLLILFFFWETNTHTHTQGRGKWVLTQLIKYHILINYIALNSILKHKIYT